jgi:hypothetical protein
VIGRRHFAHLRASLCHGSGISSSSGRTAALRGYDAAGPGGRRLRLGPFPRMDPSKTVRSGWHPPGTRSALRGYDAAALDTDRYGSAHFGEGRHVVSRRRSLRPASSRDTIRAARIRRGGALNGRAEGHSRAQPGGPRRGAGSIARGSGQPGGNALTARPAGSRGRATSCGSAHPRNDGRSWANAGSLRASRAVERMRRISRSAARSAKILA